jgi:hypothetical protein
MSIQRYNAICIFVHLNSATRLHHLPPDKKFTFWLDCIKAHISFSCPTKLNNIDLVCQPHSFLIGSIEFQRESFSKSCISPSSQTSRKRVHPISIGRRLFLLISSPKYRIKSFIVRLMILESRDFVCFVKKHNLWSKSQSSRNFHYFCSKLKVVRS